MDAQGLWELTALNALEQAVQANCILAQTIDAAVSVGKPLDVLELLALIRETQQRLARDVRQLRKITQQREKEQL
jgi:predicted proteasome-type protease